MANSLVKERKSASERANERVDVRAELAQLEAMLSALKHEYEQHFLGYSPYAPDKLHRDVKQLIRRLRKAPFKNSQMTYNLRTLENRYNTFNTYWQRTQRERENGTYHRDVFKANMRERHQKEDAEAGTQKGKVNSSMQHLFDSYRTALEKQSGTKQNIDFDKFKKSLVQRAKDFKAKNGNQKMSFQVVVKDGRVTLQAKAK